MTDKELQKHREAIYSKYPDWSDSQIEIVLEMIEAVSLILK